MCMCMCVEIQFLSSRTLKLIMHTFKGHSYVKASCCKKYVAKWKASKYPGSYYQLFYKHYCDELSNWHTYLSLLYISCFGWYHPIIINVVNFTGRIPPQLEHGNYLLQQETNLNINSFTNQYMPICSSPQIICWFYH